jgi:accessory colonization factor AcfC
MGVRAGASLYDSTDGKAFGPVFDTVEEADAFLDWYNWADNENNTADLRELEPLQLETLIDKWYKETH